MQITERKADGTIVTRTEPDPIPQEPVDFSQFTVRDLLAAFVASGSLTQARMDNILNRLKR